MSGRNAAKGSPPHARVHHEVADSPAWRVLGFSDRALYLDLRVKMRFPHHNGNIAVPLSEMKHRGWRSSATLSKSLRNLGCMGLIAKTRQGGIASMSKVCSLYRFTDLPVPEWPKLGISAQAATHDYKRFESVREAAAALREISVRKKTKLQKMKLIASETEPMRRFIASESEQVTPSKLQKLNKRNPPKTRAANGFDTK